MSEKQSDDTFPMRMSKKQLASGEGAELGITRALLMAGAMLMAEELLLATQQEKEMVRYFQSEQQV